MSCTITVQTKVLFLMRPEVGLYEETEKETARKKKLKDNEEKEKTKEKQGKKP